jgi:NIMA (never in mitosis gene a)-related kinase
MNKLSQKEKENALNEVRLLASIDNEYIVSYKDAFYEESQGCLCLVMELLEGGSL